MEKYSCSQEMLEDFDFIRDSSLNVNSKNDK